jgi:tellurite resistance protein
MHNHQESMLKSLIAIAWADGRFDTEEEGLVEVLLDSLGAYGEDAEKWREYAKTPRTLEDVELTYLSESDRVLLLNHAVLLSYVDGEQSEDERTVLQELVSKLGLETEQASAILTSAADRSKKLLAQT